MSKAPAASIRGGTEAPAVSPEHPAAGRPEGTETDLSLVPEEDLIFGGSSQRKPRVIGEPTGRMTPQRLQTLAKQKPSEAKRFRVAAVLHLPGGRMLDFGSSEVEPGIHTVFQRVREATYPTTIKLADIPESGPFPVMPTTPGEFESRNAGIEIEVDVTPAPGTLVLGGRTTHRIMDAYGRMPGEIFSPLYAKSAGGGEEIILTENKVLQPQFSIAETPFLAAAAPGEACRVPVRMSWGLTTLELTCTPVE